MGCKNTLCQPEANELPHQQLSFPLFAKGSTVSFPAHKFAGMHQGITTCSLPPQIRVKSQTKPGKSFCRKNIKQHQATQTQQGEGEGTRAEMIVHKVAGLLLQR